MLYLGAWEDYIHYVPANDLADGGLITLCLRGTVYWRGKGLLTGSL